MLVDVGSPSRNLEIGTTHWLNLTSYAVVQVSSLFSETMDQNSATLVPKIKQLAVLEIHHLIHLDKHRHWLTNHSPHFGFGAQQVHIEFRKKRFCSCAGRMPCHCVNFFKSCRDLPRKGWEKNDRSGWFVTPNWLFDDMHRSTWNLAFSWQQRHGETLPRRKLRELACSEGPNRSQFQWGLHRSYGLNLRHGAPNPAWSLWYEETSIHTPNSCGMYIAYIYI